ncbi:Ger(x)C family spore germination protein [Paenibacillus sp. GCM10023248]|uniref:Ger(x)C family spore germination protein n=1 Tax=Bacillales TaxID=1385 RepID=UPI002379EBDE|nr:MULTISPECIES: Ger(x)C family spore germination protein [Bacillales]MDD9268958.1 Ger(x)C family spore germination protein [Paenibacillus sp. MAHUQ-63]MDR6881962.1 spore germination protein KC [Bacillus sp. 3255]
MIARMRIIACLLVIVLLVSGCWSRRELNDIAIAEGVGIDITDHQFELTVQIVNPGSVTKAMGNPNIPIIVYSSKGVTLNEAVKRLTSSISRNIYFAHIRILAISEELAEQGIVEAMDYLMRGSEFRSDFDVVIARDTTAKDLLSIMTPLEQVPANYIYNSLEAAKKEWTSAVTIKLDQLSKAIVTPGRSPVISGIQIVGEYSSGSGKANINYTTPKVRLQYSGNAIFKRDRLVGWLNEKESRAYSVITDQAKRSSIHVPCPEGGNIGIDIARVKSKVHAVVTNEKPEIFIELMAEGNVSDVECKIDLLKVETIAYLDQQITKLMEDNLEHTIKKTQQLGTDIYGFGEAVHRADYRYWNKVKDNWEQVFKQLTPHLKIVARVRGTGTLGDSVVNDVKE